MRSWKALVLKMELYSKFDVLDPDLQHKSSGAPIPPSRIAWDTRRLLVPLLIMKMTATEVTKGVPFLF